MSLGRKFYFMGAFGALKFYFHSTGVCRLLPKYSDKNGIAGIAIQCVPAALCDTDCDLVASGGTLLGNLLCLEEREDLPWRIYDPMDHPGAETDLG